VKERRSYPQFNRLSAVAAMILLAYALLPFIQPNSGGISFKLLGILIEFNANFNLAIAFLAAGLAISGTDWIIRDHPHRGRQPVYPHYLLPALTAAVIGIPLGLIKVNLQWWAVFGLGSLLLLAVLMTEYISVDRQDSRHALAQMLLTAVSFGLLLTLAISIRAANLRLYLFLFALVPVFSLLCLRLFFLRLEGQWNWEWALAITLIIAQAAIGLYYLPLSPVRYGLILMGAAYGLIEMAASIQPGKWEKSRIIEPALVSGLFWLMAAFLG
jgi:hypothetical protein